MISSKLYYTYREAIIKFATKVSGKKVLDVGCGTGDFTMIFRRKNCITTGIDIVDNRKPEFSNFHFIRADAKKLPFKNEVFDAVVSFDVVEHIDKDNLFIREACRVCKKNGLFFLGTPNRNRLSNLLRKIIGRQFVYPLKLGKDCIHLREYDINNLTTLIIDSGFKIIRKKSLWFGLVGIFGLRSFPKFLNNFSQYIFVTARKI